MLSKIYEGMNQLHDHVSHLYSKLLSAFRKGYGCEHVLLHVTEHWKDALDNDKGISTMTMDLSKTFDCVPHSLLIAKLNAYGSLHIHSKLSELLKTTS